MRRFGPKSTVEKHRILYPAAFCLIAGLAVAGCSSLGRVVGINLFDRPALTTGLGDAVTEVPFLDDFNPSRYYPLAQTDLGANGDFVLRPGAYSYNAMSYCLHAGRHRPGGGDGYVYASLKGDRAAIILNILSRSAAHPDIPQRDIQTLIWAILSRAKIIDMSRVSRRSALSLLTPAEIVEANGGALGFIPDAVFQSMLAKLPEGVQKALEAERQLRDAFSRAEAAYEDLERIAVLTGEAGIGPDSRSIPEGRWSLHPNRFLIRYFPSSYSRTAINIYVPEIVHVGRDARGRITSISDARGNRIETTYDDDRLPLSLDEEPMLKGYCFETIRFLKVAYASPEIRRISEARWLKSGWTFVGSIQGGKKAPSGTSDYPGIRDSYQATAAAKGDADRLGRTVTSAKATKETVDLAHFAVAIKAAVRAGKPDLCPWSEEHLLLLSKAWLSALLDVSGANSPDGVSIFKDAPSSHPSAAEDGTRTETTGVVYAPAGNDAVPGNTNRQRLGVSGREAEPAKKKDPCDVLRNRLAQIDAILMAYGNKDLIDAANSLPVALGPNETLEQARAGAYQTAVENFFNVIMDQGGAGNFDPSSMSPGDFMDLFRSIPGKGGGEPVKTLMQADANDFRVYGEVDGQKVIVLNPDGTANLPGYNAMMNEFIFEYGDRQLGILLFNECLEHEKVHISQYKQGRFGDTPDMVSQLELEAYRSSRESILAAMRKFGC